MTSPETHPAHASPGGEDGVNLKLILAVGAVSLATFAASAIIAFVIVERDTARLRATRGEALPAPGIGQAEIGIVDQVHFDQDRRLDDWRAGRRHHLASYGWVDRQKGLIHIPISEAMKDLIAAVAHLPAPPPVAIPQPAPAVGAMIGVAPGPERAPAQTAVPASAGGAARP